MYDAMLCESVMVAGNGGQPIEAYTARPLGSGPRGGVLVLHHMPGYDAETKEIVRRFAFEGYNAICPNLHYHYAPAATAAERAELNKTSGGVPDDQFLGDAAGAVSWCKRQMSSNGKVGTIGYCSGGRQSFLAACRMGIDAAVICYGNFIVAEPPAGRRFGPILDQAAEVSCPVLGLFGAEDMRPSPAEAAAIDERLTELGKPHEVHVYENTGHAFFAVNQDKYRVAAANDGWRRILEFYDRHLSD